MQNPVQTAINRLPLKGYEKNALEKAVVDRKDFLSLDRSFLERFTGRQLRIRKSLKNMRQIWESAEQECEFNKKSGIEYIAFSDAEYPELLREIYNPPYLLYYKGTITQIPAVAIVGTRKPTPDAAAEAFACACEESTNGFAIVSGLAVGIDEAAHWGALSVSGITLAVLGSGPDYIYPAENRYLAEKIIDSGGALLSEYPAGTAPDRFRFPERNRIVSGMCSRVILIEAPEKSGALITADFCLEQNRDLSLSARVLDSPFNEGGRRLYQDGAELRYSQTPVVSGLSLMSPENIGRLLEDELSGLATLYKGSYIYNVY